MTIKKALGAISIALIVFILLTITSAVTNRLTLIKQVWDLPPATHQMGSVQELMLPMRDGVKLWTLEQLPEGEGPWPAILIRNPYETMGVNIFNMFCELFVSYGYACVYQEARGQMQSEGEWEPLVNEPNDTSDTLYWMAEQDWNDGNIGMWGVSYLALTQWAGAMDYPPELKTFMPTSMGTDFHKILYENGNFRLFISLWVLLMPDRGVNIQGVIKFWEAAVHFPHKAIDEKYAGKKLPWYQEWIRDVGTADPTWQREDAIAVKDIAAKLTVPVLIYEGWYDPFFNAELQDYQNLATREQSRLVIGPWSHIQQKATSLDVEVDDAMKMSTQAMLDWFDYHLRGNTEADASAYVKTYDLGAAEWKTRKSWPPQTRTMAFSLEHFEQANSCEGGKLLPLAVKDSEEVPDESEASSTSAHSTPAQEQEQQQAQAQEQEQTQPQDKITYFYDPENPVPSRGGASYLGPLSLSVAPGALSQEGFCEREDVLTFQSEAFDTDITIAGNMLVKLLVSSDAEDTAFTAKLMDVAPDGSAVNIRDSISTLAYRNQSPSALVYTPNAIVEVVMNMWPIEWTLKQGHSLRVDISSSNFPAYNIHANYAGNWAAQESFKIAQQSLYQGSFIELPVLAE